MKKIISIIVFGIGLSSSTVFAQTQNTPAQNQGELAARVNYSREQLKVLMEQIVNQHPNEINHGDYQQKMAPFIASLEQKMNSFDHYLQNTLLATLQEDIHFYNSLVKDKESSQDQINQTLPGVYERIQMKVDLIKNQYAAEILSLFEIFGDFPHQLTDAGNGFSKLLTINHRSIRYQNTPGLDSNTNVFQNYVVPMLAADCKSYTCVTYTASDYGKLLEGLAEKIDQDFIVTLTDKKTFTIPSLHLDVKTAIAIMQTKTYPKWVTLDLPIDFKETK